MWCVFGVVACAVVDCVENVVVDECCLVAYLDVWCLLGVVGDLVMAVWLVATFVVILYLESNECLVVCCVPLIRKYCLVVLV